MYMTTAGAPIADIELTGDAVSDWVDLGPGEQGNVAWTGLSINLAWTGTGAGVFTLEAANVPNDSYAVTLPQNAENAPTAGGSPVMLTVAAAHYRLVRLHYNAFNTSPLILTAVAVRK